MKLKDIAEEWDDFAKSSYNDGKTYGIYINPKKEDYLALRKEEGSESFRYIVRIYGKSVIYVFNSDLLHYDAAKVKGIPYKTRMHAPIWGDYAFGVSKLIDGKLELENGVVREIKRMGKKNFDLEFLNIYFNNIP